MSNQQYILDVPLPTNQDFVALKKKGLGIIEELSGAVWNNYNSSDPGVTILDQICYALTELGYCNDFSIQDILTRENGSIDFKNQFYFPQEILTSAPVTIADYKKFVLATVQGVNNLIITTTSIPLPSITRTYSTLLYINPEIDTKKMPESICKTVFYQLNKSRNVGELFLKPKCLTPVPFELFGRLEVKSPNNLTELITNLNAAINNFIFPTIQKNSYNQLTLQGISTDDLYNGPYLPDGWIDSSSFTNKKDTISLLDLAQVIQQVAGIENVVSLNFSKNATNTSNPTCSSNEILTLDINEMVTSDKLVLVSKGQILIPEKNPILSVHVNPNSELLVTDKIDVKQNIPHGKYRNIEDYYSIQNTFPEMYGIGANAINAPNNNYRTAQSKQLQGYLTLIDQVLANQLSQLNNISSLFSFVNATTGDPKDRTAYYAKKSKSDLKHPKYPVPYRASSPTYFYQSLYDVPYIKPLLKNNEAFNFTTELLDQVELEKLSWEKYKADPYNAYIHGLMEIVENDEENYKRRNQLLDHLLARHGESPLYIDALLNTTTYTGNTWQDKVVYKSLYLQNLAQLTYNRRKAYNYIGASQIIDTIESITTKYLDYLRGGYFSDFIFNSTLVNEIEKITTKDINNYSAIELKLSLLLGVKNAYKDFIALNSTPEWVSEKTSYTEITSPPITPETGIALWMIQERKGLILLETRLLFEHIPIQFNITMDVKNGPFYSLSSHLDYQNAINLYHHLQTTSKPDFSANMHSLTVNKNLYNLIESSVSPVVHQSWIACHLNGYFILPNLISDKGISKFSITSNKLQLIFPNLETTNPPKATSGLLQFNSPAFKQSLELFLENELPCETQAEVYLANASDLIALIPAFTAWHNSLLYYYPNPTVDSQPNPHHKDKVVITSHSQKLLGVLETLKLMAF